MVYRRIEQFDHVIFLCLSLKIQDGGQIREIKHMTRKVVVYHIYALYMYDLSLLSVILSLDCKCIVLISL